MVNLGALVLTVPLVLRALPDLLDKRVRRVQQEMWDRQVQQARLDRKVRKAQQASKETLAQQDQAAQQGFI
jgi:hypothetical protein